MSTEPRHFRSRCLVGAVRNRTYRGDSLYFPSPGTECPINSKLYYTNDNPEDKVTMVVEIISYLLLVTHYSFEEVFNGSR